MRLLANENFPLRSVHRLREAGHDVGAVIEDPPGAKDQEVLARAVAEQRIVLTTRSISIVRGMAMMEKSDHIRAHTHSSLHYEEVLNSKICGCFYCLAIFEPDKIEKWIDDRQTALCPRCSIDSVIGSASGFPINREFLSKMHTYWFSASTGQKSGAQHL